MAIFVSWLVKIVHILVLIYFFRCEEHLYYTRLRWLVGWSVGPSPTMRLRGKLVTSRLLREEEEDDETDYVAIPLHRDSITSQFLRT
jgi:hypothetical protein